MRRIPRLFGWRKPALIRTVEKVAGDVEKFSIREMQSLIYRMKQTYREDHRIYSQRYGFQTTQNDHAITGPNRDAKDKANYSEFIYCEGFAFKDERNR